MMVKILITFISGERFSLSEAPVGRVGVSVGVNIQEVRREKEKIEATFRFSVNYMPQIAQIVVKGKIIVKGEEKQLDKIWKKYEEKRKPPVELINMVIGASLAEAVIISKSLGVPPPIPPPIMTNINKALKKGEEEYRL